MANVGYSTWTLRGHPVDYFRTLLGVLPAAFSVTAYNRSESSHDHSPFIADIWGTAQTHQLMPETVNANVANDMLYDGVGAWLEKYNGWNASYYPELLGSVALVLPNPFYSKMHIHVIPRSDRILDQYDVWPDDESAGAKDSETIKIEFTPRHGIDLKDFRVVPFEKTYFGLAGGQEYPIVDNICRIPTVGVVTEEFGCYVKDGNANLVDFKDFSSFQRRYSLEINVGSRVKVIEDPKSHEISKIQTFDKAAEVKGGENERPLRKRLTEADIRRERRREIEKSGVKLFYQEHDTAVEYINTIIDGARNSVVIVDPYAATNELFAEAMRVKRNCLAIKIYTSVQYLKQKSKLDVYSEKGIEVPTLGEELWHNARSYQEKTGMDVQVFVMTGDRAAVHDRFLIVDDIAWFCGGSFNEIGNRLSCVARLPDSEELKGILADMEKDRRIKPLEVWMRDRNGEENETVQEEHEEKES